MSACSPWHGPLFVSYPHFLNADPILLDNFDIGSELNPDMSKHESFMSIDPKSGIILESVIRMQMNVLARPLVIYNPETNWSISVE